MDYGAGELAMHKSNIRINAKQSTFKGSTRWVRSHIIKHLLQFGPTKEHDVYVKCAQPWRYHDEQFARIVDKMIVDGLLLRDGEMISLTE